MRLTQVALRDIELDGSVVHATTPIVLEAQEVTDLSTDIFATYQEKINPSARRLEPVQREANADTYLFACERGAPTHLHVIYDIEETRLALECQSETEAAKVFRLWREQRIIHTNLDFIREQVRGSLGEISAAVLWQIGAIKVSLGDLRPLFTVDEGKNRSPIYLDLKLLPDYPVTNDFMVSQAALLLRDIEFDALCGVEAGSIAFAALLAQKLAKPMFFARRLRKFPEASLLEGIKPHELFRKRVVLVDDTLVRGWTKERVIQDIRTQGGIIDTCFVIFDRQQVGSQSLEQSGVRLRSLTNREAALSHAIPREITFLTDAEDQEIRDYFADPAAWHRRRKLEYHELTPTA
jgi:orotate phosphoribosyltransferase